MRVPDELSGLLLLSLLLGVDGRGATFVATPSAAAARGVMGTASPAARTTSATSVCYKNGSEDEEEVNGKKRDIFARSKRPSKKTNRKKKMRRSKDRSYQLHKKGVPVEEDELAHHVQSVFSDLAEFAIEEEEEGDDEPCILSEAEEAEVEVDSAPQRQLDNCRKLERHPALVLNADYQPLRMLPLSIWSWQDTVKAVLSGKAHVVDTYPGVFVRAVSIDMPVPSVIALREYAPTGKARPAFTRRNVFLRDGYRCQYCGELFRTSDLSLDHVEPRCFGGKLTWDNTVTCCKKCNGRKGCLRPSELHHVGMQLRTVPRCPSLFELAAEATKFVPRRVHPTWAPFLGLPAKNEVPSDGEASGGAKKAERKREERKRRKKTAGRLQ